MMQDINRSNFSNNLIKLRRKKGLTQEELSKLSGITRRMIAYYETKGKKPSIDKIEALALALKVDIHELLGINNSANDNANNELEEIDPRTLKKIKLILSLPKQQRHMIYSMAESLIDKSKQKNRKKSKQRVEAVK